jgi:hypothetical protein
MKNFFTGAFLMFTGITLLLLGIAAITFLVMLVGPMVPAWLGIVLGVAAPFLFDMGQNFYNWKNS